MGIQGLLPFLKDATHHVNVRKYSGCSVAVDTYCWIHRGAFGCAMQLAKGEQTDMYVRYCLKFINMLRAMDIKPILVFDGSRLPAKKAVEESRRERRELYSKKGKQFLREGKVSDARDCFTKCVNVTPHMALEVIKAATSLGVDCIVAPYEADVQLAFLAKCGIAQAVITEDSDLVAFGCPRIIYKLDLNGNGLEIAASRLNLAMKMGDRFSMDKFRYMCIASGCDYLASLPGIGLGKARKLFQTATNPDLNHVLKRLPIHLKMKLTVPPEYITGFHQANNTFLYQLVFDPIKRRLVPLHPYSDSVDKETLTYAGSYCSSDLALQQALGNVDPNTKKFIWDFQPQYNKSHDKSVSRHTLSIWHKNYSPRQDFMEEDQAEVQRHTTNGKEVVLMVNAMKKENQCRKRPRPDEHTPSNDDLTSIYGSPNAKRHSTGQTLVIPETPESREKEPVKSSPRHPNPFSKEGGHKSKSGFGAEERVSKTLSRRNIFAVGRTSSSSRLDILKGSTIVTSRFFPNKSNQKPKDVDNGLERKCLPPNQPVCVDEICSSVDVINEQDMTSNTDNTHEDIGMEQHQGSVKSTLNMLQRFQRNTSALALPSTRSESSKSISSGESTKESALGSVDISGMMTQPELNSESEDLSSQESCHGSMKSEARGTTQRRTGAFCWSRTSTSVTTLKKEESARKFRSLSDFRKVTRTTRLERDDSHIHRQLGDLELSQGALSQGSCMVSLESQQSQLCSIDTNSLSLSQLSGQYFAEDNSQTSESHSLCVENKMNSSQIKSHQEGISSPLSKSELLTDSQEQNQDMDTNSPDDRKQHIATLTEKHREVCKCDEYLSADSAGCSQNDVGCTCRVSEMVSTLEKEGEELIDFSSKNDENASPTSKVKTQEGLIKKKKQDFMPSLPTFPKLKLGMSSNKLSQCKAPGLSRSQKSKQTPNADENRVSGTKQQTLFAFIKSNHGRKDVTMPLSPSKQNVTSDITPEGAKSIYNKGIQGVQRKIFK